MINLMHGDCLDRMKDIPAGSVDLVLTDPPYGMAFQSNYRKERHAKIHGDAGLGWLGEFCRELSRVMKMDSAAYVFCSFSSYRKVQS